MASSNITCTKGALEIAPSGSLGVSCVWLGEAGRGEAGFNIGGDRE